jgi:hypothetical protein
VVLSIKLQAQHILGKYSATELLPQTIFTIFLNPPGTGGYTGMTAELIPSRVRPSSTC